MNACTAKREGKLIDARFVRALSERERSRMEDHLILCGLCRERYSRLQLAERAAAGDLEAPSPFEIDRIAEGLGLEAPPRSRFDLRIFAGALSVAAAVAFAGLFLRPTDDLVARGGPESKVTFSLFALSDRGARPLVERASVSSDEHLKLRMSGAAASVDVVLVLSDGRMEHVRLAAPKSGSVPGAVSLADLPLGSLTAYAVSAEAFDLEKVRPLLAGRSDAGAIERALGEGTSVERFELDLGAPR